MDKLIEAQVVVDHDDAIYNVLEETGFDDMLYGDAESYNENVMLADMVSSFKRGGVRN